MCQYSFPLIISLLGVCVYNTEPSSFEIEIPLVYVYNTSAKSVTIEEFISMSYQPVTITRALSGKVLERLKPWDFTHISTSLEAATTFCTAEYRLLKPSVINHACENLDKSGEKEKTNRIKAWNGKENEKIKRKKMSLRRFALEGKENWVHSFTDVTKEIGMMIKLPKFLEDFEFDTAETVDLHHIRAGFVSQNDRSSQSFSSTSVVCLVEGAMSFILTPFDIPWDWLWCEEKTCTLHQEEKVNEDVASKIFLTRVDLQSRDCLYIPLEWQWQFTTFVDSISLRILWEEDLSIQEEVLEKLIHEDNLIEKIYNSPSKEKGETNHQGKKTSSKKRSKTLWEVLPRTFWRSPVLWSDENPLLHLVRFYLLSSQERNLNQFLHDFRVDRGILPDLVDCPLECEASAKRIFTLLDTDADRFLSSLDAIYLTQDTFAALTLEMDDLVDELKELGVQQWTSVVERGGDHQFMDRAKERMQEGAKATMRRIMAGDIDENEELEMKEKLPGLYADVMAAREAKQVVTGKNEL